MYQKFIIVGRLTEDATLRYTQQGKPVLGFRVITSKKSGDKEYSFAIDASIWGKLGEALANYMVKGQLILAEGELRQESWDGRDGNKHYKTVLAADQVRLLGGKREGDGQQRRSPVRQVQATQAQALEAPVLDNDPFADF